jgi:hypothetical protein
MRAHTQAHARHCKQGFDGPRCSLASPVGLSGEITGIGRGDPPFFLRYLFGSVHMYVEPALANAGQDAQFRPIADDGGVGLHAEENDPFFTTWAGYA